MPHRRIAWLICERRAQPGSILAITYTHKAAAEMMGRVEDLVGKRARIMRVSTFHPACVRILRAEIDWLGCKCDFDHPATNIDQRVDLGDAGRPAACLGDRRRR